MKKILFILFTIIGIVACKNQPESNTTKEEIKPIEDYQSVAGKIMDTHKTNSGNTPEDMVNAANKFLLLLSEKQKEKALLKFSNSERKKWSNAPARGNQGGIALGELDTPQLKAAYELLASLLSSQGYEKVKQIMLGDDLRSIIDGKINTGVGINAFRIILFGTPSTSSTWSVQLDGHHIALNITLGKDDAYSMSPSFIGTFPKSFRVAGKTYQPLTGKINQAFELINSLNEQQLKEAIISDKRGKLRAAAGKDGVVPAPIGILANKMNKIQSDLLVSLASQWFNIMPARHAQTAKANFIKNLNKTKFSWHGSIKIDSDISFTIQGPSFYIEMANDHRGGSDGGNPVDHVHTMFRDFSNEYGVYLSHKTKHSYSNNSSNHSH